MLDLQELPGNKANKVQGDQLDLWDPLERQEDKVQRDLEEIVDLLDPQDNLADLGSVEHQVREVWQGKMDVQALQDSQACQVKLGNKVPLDHLGHRVLQALQVKGESEDLVDPLEETHSQDQEVNQGGKGHKVNEDLLVLQVLQENVDSQEKEVEMAAQAKQVLKDPEDLEAPQDHREPQVQ